MGAGASLAAGGGVDLVQLHVAGLDDELAPLGHGVARVDGQVGDDLLHLAGVGLHPPQPGVEDGDELDVLADEPPEHGLDTGHHRVEVQDAQLEDLLAAEGQEMARQGGGAAAELRISTTAVEGWPGRSRSSGDSRTP